MFSGIVETIGMIVALHHEGNCKHFSITPAHPFHDLMIGDSISINGVCLTVTNLSDNTFHVTAVPETLRVTNLGSLTLHSQVNLERSLKVGARLGGHFVQGHVDCVGQITELEQDQNSKALLLKIAIPKNFAKYIVPKGFIALDGMSITVIQANLDHFTITLIPHTQDVTIAKDYKIGKEINIEVDMLGKYIEKLTGVQMQ